MPYFDDPGFARVANRSDPRFIELRMHADRLDGNHRVVTEQPVAAETDARRTAIFPSRVAITAGVAIRAEHVPMPAELVVNAECVIGEILTIDTVVLVAQISIVVTQPLGASRANQTREQ